MKDRVEKICKATIKEMGFTEKMIRDLLPEPELKQNPQYKHAAPMKLWVKSEVESIMKTDAYKAAAEKAARRKASAAKAVATKTDTLMAEMAKKIEQISVRRISIEELVDTTLRCKQAWYDWHGNWDEYRTVDDADEETVMRWMVNYVRHNLTDYDHDLFETSGKVGKYAVYLPYFKAVMEKIAETYPELKDECEDQVRKKTYTSWISQIA